MADTHMPRVVLYARVSTDRQVEFNVSIPSQLGALKSYCEDHNWHVVGQFIDEGVSGTLESRPKFQEMMRFVLDDGAAVDIVFTYSLSRFARNVETLTKYLFSLRHAGIAIKSLTEDYDDQTAMGRLMTIMSGTIDEMRIADDRKHTIRALRKNAEDGFFNGSRPPFGYMTQATDLPARSGRKKKVVLHEGEADVVRQIWDLYEFGQGGMSMGMKNIAVYLNERGIPRRGAKWTAEYVRWVLSDTVYTGALMYGGRGKRTGKIGPPISITVPQIVASDRFERIKVRRHERSPTKNPPTHVSPTGLLTGIIRCGLCGSAMTKSTGKRGRYRYYKCTKRNSLGNDACESVNLPAPKLESLVLDVLCERVLTRERYQAILEDCKKNIANIQRHESAETRELLDAKKSVERKIALLCSVIEGAQLNDKAYIARRARELERDLASVEVRLADLKLKVVVPEGSLDDEKVPAFLDHVRQVLSDPTSPEARACLRTFVSEIRVYRDESTIKGSYLGAAQALAEDSVAHARGVPKFTSKWRAWQDSNLQPSA